MSTTQKSTKYMGRFEFSDGTTSPAFYGKTRKDVVKDLDFYRQTASEFNWKGAKRIIMI